MGRLGLWSGQYLFRDGIGFLQTEQVPPGFRLGTRTLFCLAAQEREQNFGFLVCWPQVGHAVMAILSVARLGAGVAATVCLRFQPSRVQRLYGRHLNQDGMVKIQSSPRTPSGRRRKP